MIGTQAELTSVLRHYNPWWTGGTLSDLPPWPRAAFNELIQWLSAPPAGRALLLAGARQIGKTTLFLQCIERLLKNGVPPGNILYVTFDHPLLKLHGLAGVVQLWREVEPAADGPEYLFLDEIQSTQDWQTWLKHQVDFNKGRRIAVTGSATPLTTEGQESGVGRWHTLQLATLSFFEFMQIKGLPEPRIPMVSSLQTLFDWQASDFNRVSADAASIIGHFHDYLLRGGFPQCALMDSLTMAQKLLREDIVDKVLKRDMTALFGVRRIVELEHTFLYLCLHDGDLLDLPQLCSNLGLKRSTVMSFIDLFEATHLIYRLKPYGYGKEVLRGRVKVYLADAAIAPSVLLKGKGLLDDGPALGRAVETAFFKHVFTRYYRQSVGFSYWRGPKDLEVDIIADLEGKLVPFEVKYRSQHTDPRDLKGLAQFCKEKAVRRGYVITRELPDFGVMELHGTPVLKIPAPLACYWLSQGEAELSR
ncbi:MAG: ATP-binding protein [Holophaga sp.]|nr:ATP-binding protein [Holophaga sp.]